MTWPLLGFWVLDPRVVPRIGMGVSRVLLTWPLRRIPGLHRLKGVAVTRALCSLNAFLHPRVASRTGMETYRRGWLLEVTDGSAKTLMDRQVFQVSSLSVSFLPFL